jgi:hypothetical protein
MFALPTLLTFRRNDTSRFDKWLEKLGLTDFLKSYPIEQLIDWGWLKPQYRVIFPPTFFEEWDNYPYYPEESQGEANVYHSLWEYTWETDKPNTALWFLDPAFRPGEPMHSVLQASAKIETDASEPKSITHKNGRLIYPYTDYFFHWQGYALVDVIRSADCLQAVYWTPNATEKHLNLGKTIAHLSKAGLAGPTSPLAASGRWGALAEPMTWLSLFRSFNEALNHHYDISTDERRTLHRQGAIELAKYLNVTENDLETFLKDGLLVLADDWMRNNKLRTSSSLWTQHAWPHLRSDIQLALIWLIAISGKSFSHYIDKWKKPYFGNLGWAPLEEVLPYAFLEHDKKLAQMGPIYLKSFNSTKGIKKKFDESRITEICRAARKSNRPFGGFLSSFAELHNHLSQTSFEDYGIDFRELRPLDHYAMLAIHAEGCLRRELDIRGKLETIETGSQTLSVYLDKLSSEKGISSKVIGTFKTNRALSDLKKDRNDPIGRIQSFKSKLPAPEHQLVQAYLCCLLARNYFAHHDFLDNELLRTSKSQFLLSGILLTVLTLLEP